MKRKRERVEQGEGKGEKGELISRRGRGWHDNEVTEIRWGWILLGIPCVSYDGTSPGKFAFRIVKGIRECSF